MNYSAEQKAKRYAYTKEWRKRNRERVNAYNLEWKKNNPDKMKAFWKKHYAKHGQNKKAYHTKWRLENREKVLADGARYRKENRDKIRQSILKWHKRHPEIVRANIKKWQIANPQRLRMASQRRRAMKRSNSSAEQIAAADLLIKKILSVEFSVCRYCSKTFKTLRMHIDHVLAIFRGGKHDPENICIACSKCNLSKGFKILFSEWMPPNAKGSE